MVVHEYGRLLSIGAHRSEDLASKALGAMSLVRAQVKLLTTQKIWRKISLRPGSNLGEGVSYMTMDHIYAHT